MVNVGKSDDIKVGDRTSAPKAPLIELPASVSIKDLAELIARLTGFEGQMTFDKSKPNGQPRRALDVSRAQKAFGFKAQIGFEEGLKRTIDWYEKNRKK